MYEKFTIFNVVSINEELEEQFHEFFYIYDLQSLFTNEHRASQIRVADIDLRATLNGAYKQDLINFRDYLLMSTDNKKYEEAIFKIIYNARSMQGMVNMIRRLMRFIDSDIKDEHKFNQWNIVWYTKDPY